VKLDFKKTQKDLYLPPTTPVVIDVPTMSFIAVNGKGDPNTSEEYAMALQLLYGLSYTIKMSHKDVLEYVVPPLEGFWSVDDDSYRGGEAIQDKSKFFWKMMLRQPEFVTPAIFEIAKESLAKKKPGIDTSLAVVEEITEGLCAQVMHIGPYDDEPRTTSALHSFILESGYLPDFEDGREHHEIYISDPRKTAPDRLKTVLRHPIRKA